MNSVIPIIALAVGLIGIVVRLFPVESLSLKFRIYTSSALLFIAVSLIALVLWLSNFQLYSILLEIIIAAILGFHLHSGFQSENKGEIKNPSDEKIPFVKILEIANQKEYGDWKIIDLQSPSRNQEHDLLIILRQAASDGDLRVWGRACLRDLPFSSDPLVPIPKEHFYEYEFSYYSLHITAKNKDTYTTNNPIKKMWELDRKNYRDLYVSKHDVEKTLKIKPQPIGIIFDSTNPHKQFWSLENGPNGARWEYRVKVKNQSSKTLKNVRISVSQTGPLPERPADNTWDKNKQRTIDINPDCEELAVVRHWPYPPIRVGMLAGPNAYGPLEVTVSADDVGPTTRKFNFDYVRTPMIFD